MKEKKLILVDTNNMMHMVVFSKYIVEKYDGLSYDEINDEIIESLYRDSLKMMIQKYFNILKYNNKFDVSILYAKDGRKIWRRNKIFSGYKAQRKKIRTDSNVDFRLVYHIFDLLWEEMKEILPCRFAYNDNVEVDDIIYRTIINEYGKYDKFQIISTDADFKQILKYKKVELYNPRLLSFITPYDPEYELFEKVLKGDKSDNIPNIYSDNRNERQKSIFSSDIKSWYENKNEFKEYIRNESKFVKQNYIRNEKLINLKRIPEDILKHVDSAIPDKENELDIRKILKLESKYGFDFIKENLQYF